jgi:hypothetical protein
MYGIGTLQLLLQIRDSRHKAIFVIMIDDNRLPAFRTTPDHDRDPTVGVIIVRTVRTQFHFISYFISYL